MANFQLADCQEMRGILFFPSSSSLRTLLTGTREEGGGYEKRTPVNLVEVRRRSYFCSEVQVSGINFCQLGGGLK